MLKIGYKALVLMLALLFVGSPMIVGNRLFIGAETALAQSQSTGPAGEVAMPPLRDEVPGYHKFYGTIKALGTSDRSLVLTEEATHKDVRLTGWPTTISDLHVGDHVTIEAINNNIESIVVH
jgi:hypothetical protein